MGHVSCLRDVFWSRAGADENDTKPRPIWPRTTAGKAKGILSPTARAGLIRCNVVGERLEQVMMVQASNQKGGDKFGSKCMRNKTQNAVAVQEVYILQSLTRCGADRYSRVCGLRSHTRRTPKRMWCD